MVHTDYFTIAVAVILTFMVIGIFGSKKMSGKMKFICLVNSAMTAGLILNAHNGNIYWTIACGFLLISSDLDFQWQRKQEGL